MASRSASIAERARQSRSRPVEHPERGHVPDLGVLDRRRLVARAHRRQARALTTLGAACVAGSLLLAGFGRAIVTSDQVRADALQSQVAQALQTQQDLQLQKAELVSPSRILAIAQTRLHMVSPGAVTYLAPVKVGQTVAQAHEPGTSRSSSHRHAARIGTTRQSPRGSTTASPARP